MHNTLLKRFLNSCSNNPSKSQTCTMGGIVAIGVAFATCGAGLVNAVDKHNRKGLTLMCAALKLTRIFSAARLDHIADRQRCTFPDGRLLQD